MGRLPVGTCTHLLFLCCAKFLIDETPSEILRAQSVATFGYSHTVLLPDAADVIWKLGRELHRASNDILP